MPDISFWLFFTAIERKVMEFSGIENIGQIVMKVLFYVLGAFGFLEITHDITRYSKAKVFSTIGKKTPCFVRFSTVGKELKIKWILNQRVVEIKKLKNI